MPLFTPDIVESRDVVGFGHWLNGHYYEHQQFIQAGIQQAPPIFFVNYDLLAWDATFPESALAWIGVHEQMHESLRGVTGVQGIDLGSVDPTDAAAFQVWMQWHATEHQKLRQVFNIT